MGHRVVIISRGYKGTAQNKGAVVSDGRTIGCSASCSGDEPYLMAMLLGDIPVVVGKDRRGAGQTAVAQFDPDIVLLDDAFQHLRLKRDLNLLLLDARNPFGNSHIFPRGRLREPVTAIADADVIVLTRSERGKERLALPENGLHMKPPQVFCTRHSGIVRGKAPSNSPLPYLGALEHAERELSESKLFAFSGLANNPSFFHTVEDAGGRLIGTLSFEDHYPYGDAAIERITAAAAQAGADRLITTDKDYVRLLGKAQFPLELIVMGVELDFMDDGTPWKKFIANRIQQLIGLRRGA